MFTTGVHEYLYAAAGCYILSAWFHVVQKKQITRVLLLAGLCIHLLYLVGRAWLGGVFIANAIFEGVFLLPLFLAAILFLQSIKNPDMINGATLALLIVFTLFAVFYVKGIIPPTPRKTSVWAIFFFVTETCAHALFYIGAVLAGRRILNANKREASPYHALIVWGFIAYTAAQVTGAVWCFWGWGNTLSWGARHLSSASIWTLYAGYLHLKFIPRWNKGAALLAVGGALYVFIISYGHYLREMQFLRVGG